MEPQAAVDRANLASDVGIPPLAGCRFPTEIISGIGLAEAAHRSGGETILLVEDEAFVRRVTAEILAAAGYRLIVANDGAEALQACRTHFEPVNLLFTDLVLPGLNGCELAVEVEILFPQIRLLLMSGYPERLALCDRPGNGRAYVSKPFSTLTLLSAVREALDQNHFRT